MHRRNPQATTTNMIHLHTQGHSSIGLLHYTSTVASCNCHEMGGKTGKTVTKRPTFVVNFSQPTRANSISKSVETVSAAFIILRIEFIRIALLDRIPIASTIDIDIIQ